MSQNNWPVVFKGFSNVFPNLTYNSLFYRHQRHCSNLKLLMFNGVTVQTIEANYSCIPSQGSNMSSSAREAEAVATSILLDNLLIVIMSFVICMLLKAYLSLYKLNR